MDKRVPTEGERADDFLDDARIEASSAENRAPTYGHIADAARDDAGIEASSAEKWSDTVRERVTMVWSSKNKRSERGSSGNAGCGRFAIA